MLSATDEKYNFDMVYQSLKEPIIIQSLDKHFGLFKAHFRVEKRIFRKFLQEKCCFIVRNRRYYRAMAKHATVLAQSHDNRRLIAECDQIYGLLKKLKEIKIKPVFKAYTARLKFKDNDKIFPSIWRTSQGGHVIFYPPVSFTMYRIPETGEHVSPAFIELQYNAIKPITNSALDEYGMLSKLLAASPASLINRDRMISLTNREAAADQVPILQIWFWWRWRMHWNPLNWSDQVVHSILQKAAPLLPELIEDKQIGYKKLEFREQYRQDMYDEITYTVLDHVFRVTYFMMFKEHTTWKGWQHREELAIPHRINPASEYKLHINVKERIRQMDGNLFYGWNFWAFLTSYTNKLLPINPDGIINIEDFRNKEFYRPYAFSELVTRDIKKFYEEHMLKWFNGLSEKYFDGDYLESAPPSKLHVLTNFLNYFIASNVIVMKEMLIDYIIEIATNIRQTAAIYIKLIYRNGQVTLVPDIDDIMASHSEMIRNVANLMLNMEFREFVKEDVVRKPNTIKTGWIDDYVLKKILELKMKLQPLFYALERYSDKLEKIYGELDPKIVFSQPLNDKPPFKSLYGQCKHYKQMLKSIRLLPEHEYLSIFIINQATFKMQVAALCTLRLKEASVVAKNFIITDAKMICDTLNELIRRMNKTIDDTEELFRMGGYTTHGIHDTVRALRTQLMKCVNRIFIIEYGLDIRDIMAIRDLILTYNALHHAMENFKIAYESSRMEKEDKLLKATEKLNRDLEEFYSMYIDNFSDLDDITKIDEYVNFLRIYKWRMRDFDKRVLWINKEETLFNIPTSTYPELDEIKALINPFAELISFISDFTRQYRIWMEGPLQALNPITLEKELDAYMKTLFVYNRTFKQKCRLHQSENYPKRFRGHVDDPEYNAWPAPIKLIYVLQNQMKELKRHMTLTGLICNPALTDRHWRQISDIVGFDAYPFAGRSLKDYLDSKMEEFTDSIEVISVSATKEVTLAENFKRLQAEWDEINFTVNDFRDSGVRILGSVDDIMIMLDDQILKTITIKGSAYVKPIEAEVKHYYFLLDRLSGTLDTWGKVQMTWLYLLPIFTSEDIVSQMPSEGKLFQEISDTYSFVIAGLERDPAVMKLMNDDVIPDQLLICLDKLDLILAGVNRYLEVKRLYFPRFFFLSNDGMLEILAETNDPLRVQPHLKACFEGIASLGFDSKLNIYSMLSEESEEVPFTDLISTAAAGGNVEKWLLQVEKVMIKSVRFTIQKSVAAYTPRYRIQWIHDWQGQVVLCVSQIFWTFEVEMVLERKSKYVMKRYCQGLEIQLSNLVKEVRLDLTKQTRITIEALAVLDIHAKDVVQELIDNKVMSSTEFLWQCQLKYYWGKDLQVLIRLTNAVVKYAYEYLGNTPRLVITPLTDRCYRTLIGAYHLHLNGAPEGPAGTGKTETTKDLAKALAVQCVVFNCSDGLDYLAMSKFFKGLASCGAWACFDEFNRIEVEVLSVIAQQILTIIQAVRAKAKHFNFEGTTLILNPAVYVCITMNPGYAGRSELPDNLKVLFRTVAMMVPDYAMIGEITLFSCGYLEARALSVKIVTTYRLCSEQLSSQSHYDYGMRAVKTVLAAAGNLKRKFKFELEAVLVLRSIIDVNLPKFLNQDVPLFQGIISDLFPGVLIPTPNYDDFIAAINTACAAKNLQAVPSFNLKIIQTYEMMIVRHGFMLVGDPFGGKTCTLATLAEALTIMNSRALPEEKTKFVTLNPKSVTMGQLYGQFDEITHEWYDGIIATYFRQLATETTPDRKWLIFDGPVDAEWIENMNTVLDDNKKLCLNSGEVIQMRPCMSMIFEVMDLAQASPATVSRCGMIYMESRSLGWEPLVKSWNNTLPALWRGFEEERILTLFNWLVPPLLEFIFFHGVKSVDAGVSNSVKTCYHLMEMLLKGSPDGAQNAKNPHLTYWIHSSFALAVYWGLGGTLNESSLEKFDEYFKELFRGDIEEFPQPDFEKIETNLPKEALLFDYMFIFRGRGHFQYIPDIIKIDRGENVENPITLLVPTLESIKFMWMMEMHIKNKVQFLITGPTGTGKSFYIQELLMSRLSTNEFQPTMLAFSPSISANQTQELIISKLLKRRRGTYGPSPRKQAVVFIDDINMPAKEVYGAQPPLELLRLFFDHKYWFDTKDTSYIKLIDILFIAAMGPPGGSKQSIYARFLRHFNLFAINQFRNESLTSIFSIILYIGLKKNGYGTEIVTTITPLVSACLRVFNEAVSHLLPTPAKSHYIFNLRDTFRVISGILLVTKEAVDSKRSFIRLWAHEIFRVFYDRLIDDSDRKWLFGTIQVIVLEEFSENFDKIFDQLELDNRPITEDGLRNLVFSAALDQDTDENKKYEEVPVRAFEKFCVDMLIDYNLTHKTKLNIILFRFALEHLSRLCRILTTPGGSGLLVGVSGSGRQSLTALAAYIYNQPIFQPQITKSYGFMDWRNDLKVLLKECGGRKKQGVFLFTETQVKADYNLQDIDALLNSAEVPNIFTMDELEEVFEMVRSAIQLKDPDINQVALYNLFKSRCRLNIHMVLCFSPIGSLFRNRVRLYPSLVNCCTIDWYEGWPEDALQNIAEFYFKKSLDATIRDAVITACKTFHLTARDISENYFNETGRNIYITSATYLNLIQSYKKLLELKQYEVMTNRERYLCGLDKLQFAAEQVHIMSEELENLKPQLKIAIEQTQKMLTDVENEKVIVDNASQRVKEDEKLANVKAAEANLLKMECEADLAIAIPILEDALSALNTLKPADITLVKSMKNPPDTVKLVMAAVCVMKGIPADRVPDPHNPGKKMLDYWGPSKRVLGDMGFLQSLKDYDKDNIPAEIMATIRKVYLPHKDFKPKIVAKASSAAEGLCKWIIALDKYDAVVKIVAPKKAKLAAAEAEFQATQKLLEQKRSELAILEEKLRKLNEQLQDASNKKQNLQKEVDLCALKLDNAHIIIGNLGGEYTRWEKAANNLKEAFAAIAGDILISCGIIAYLAPLTATFRRIKIDDWISLLKQLKIPFSGNYSLVGVLGNELKIEEWTLAGLPSDTFSTDNAIIMANSGRWPLFIDPQGQANKWIKQLEKNNKLEIIRLNQKTYMQKLEKCVEKGYPILLENILEDLDPPFDPILFKLKFKQGSVEYMSLGDVVVEYNNAFRFYITTKLRNPHYMPEIFNKTTIINFALSVGGLAGQLLGTVVAKERPDLQEKRQVLLIESATNKKALQKAEDDILTTLSSVKGNILEDENATLTLEHSKHLAADIQSKYLKAEKNTALIENIRMKYKRNADHTATLYYTVTELPNIDPMYQFSLRWFINLYISCIESSRKSDDVKKRLEYLSTDFQIALYLSVTRSLFNKDKILYSFILCTTLLLTDKQITETDLQFLLTAGVALENLIPNPVKEWLPNKSWDELCRVDDLPAFKGFCESFNANKNMWKSFYDLTAPKTEDIPEEWHKKLTSLQHLIVVRIFRPDQLVPLLIEFVSNSIGPKFVEPTPFDLATSYLDSNCVTPLVLILSAGVDPMHALMAFASKMGYDNRLHTISLGQGQGPIAERMIATNLTTGDWVCLQNCHLAISFMPTLEYIIENLEEDDMNPNFRIFLTSYPTNKFPTMILQEGVKITNEAPTGLQMNLLRSYTSDPLNDPSFYQGCPKKLKAFARLLFGMAFFHAVVQERRKYGALGWNIAYGFNESDFHISIQQLQMYLNKSVKIPFKAILYLTGECNYGGRVTDNWDRRCLNTLLQSYINQNIINRPGYNLCEGDTVYNMPTEYGHKDFINFIKKLPKMPSPNVYGFHENAEMVKNLNSTWALLEAILLARGSAGGAVLGGADQFLLSMTKDILSKLPEPFNIELSMRKYPTAYMESMNTVLVQEMERYNRLYFVIKQTLIDLQKAIKGAISITTDLESLSNSLMLAKIPAIWAKFSYPSLKPVSAYITDFVARLKFLQDWYDYGKPRNFWLSGFYFTQAFLTGTLQNYARFYRIPIDHLTFDFQVMMKMRTNYPPKEGVFVYGLYVDGARWHKKKHCLVEQLPKVLVEPLPLISIIPVKKLELVEGTRYVCPLYKTSERKGILSTTGHSTNYVLPILLDTRTPSQHWIRRGVAALCQLDT